MTATFPPDHSGTGVVCLHNALGLARLGHHVTVFTAARPGTEPVDPPEITVQRLPAAFRFGNAPFLPQLRGLAGFDIVHLHYPFYFGAGMVWLRSLYRDGKYIVTYHQDVLFEGPLQFVEKAHHRLLGQRILHRASKVLATSWDYARASRLGPLLAERPNLVEEMPNGVDACRFRPDVDGTGVRARYSLGPTDLVVLFVGALDRAHYFKGIGVLLRAFTQLQGGNVRLLVVGDGNLRSRYQVQSAALGLGERAFFCGRVPDAELPGYYAASDLLVLPSTTRGEAFGVVLLEAMASGKPVVASNLPGLRSVVHDGADGYLVEPRDAKDLACKLKLLRDDPQLRREMGAQGRASVEAQYDWPRIIPRLERVYTEVLGDG